MLPESANHLWLMGPCTLRRLICKRGMHVHLIVLLLPLLSQEHYHTDKSTIYCRLGERGLEAFLAIKKERGL